MILFRVLRKGSVNSHEQAQGEDMQLDTWAGMSSFEYSCSVQSGTEIFYGADCSNRAVVTQSEYRDLLLHFSGLEVKIGTSRTDPPERSVGQWLRTHVTRTALVSYIGPILIHEGYAERGRLPDRIRFKPPRS